MKFEGRDIITGVDLDFCGLRMGDASILNGLDMALSDIRRWLLLEFSVLVIPMKMSTVQIKLGKAIL